MLILISILFYASGVDSPRGLLSLVYLNMFYQSIKLLEKNKFYSNEIGIINKYTGDGAITKGMENSDIVIPLATVSVDVKHNTNFHHLTHFVSLRVPVNSRIILNVMLMEYLTDEVDITNNIILGFKAHFLIHPFHFFDSPQN